MIEKITLLGLILAIAALLVIDCLIVWQRRKEQENLESFKKWVAKKAGENVEQRCQHCAAGPECPGYDSGVIYPCKHYRQSEE